MSTTNVVAIIPAKGYSRGIPYKNLVPFGEEQLPLVQYTIQSALQSDVDEVYVVTSSDKTKQLAEKFSVKTVDAPHWLSHDGVQAEMAVYYALFDILPVKPTVFVCLQPTSPLRHHLHINEAVKLYYDINMNYKKLFDPPYSVFSAYELDKYAYQMDGIVAEPIQHNPLVRLGREEADDTNIAIENGAIYVVSYKQLMRYKTFRVPPMVPYYMAKEESIEIDTYTDLSVAEVLRKALGKKNDNTG